MTGTVLENLSTRKLVILTAVLLLAQLGCFLLGGLIAPQPSSAPDHLGTLCYDPDGNRTKWMYPRGKGSCKQMHIEELFEPNSNKRAENAVFTFQLPHPKEKQILDFTRWQQNLMGILQLEVEHSEESRVEEGATLLIDARLAYRNKWDKDEDWKWYAESMEVRTLECNIDEPKEGHTYLCELIPLFELGSLHHDFYLLNIRLPAKPESEHNKGIGIPHEMHLVTIYQNGGFTKVWFSLKTFFTPIVMAVLVWYWRRVQTQGRPVTLLEKMIFVLGIAMEFLNMPLEWFTLHFNMPYMLLLSDIRQGIFYATLLSFWLVFAGEHLMESGRERTTAKTYWKHLSAVAVGTFCLFLFDLCERGTHLVNPFYSLWATPAGEKLGFSLIIVASVSAGLYFIFLCWMIAKVFRNISSKRLALPAMSSVRRAHYKGIIYRFKFLMMATLTCAAMTVIGFILGQVTEDKWKWEGGDIEIQYTSAFYTGVYGMWNIYISALLILYAPSHKQWAPDRDPYITNSNATEEIEFTRLEPDTSEISALAAFAKKAATD